LGSLAKAGEQEGDEAKPTGCSPEHGLWWRGGTTVVKSGSGEVHGAQVLERGRELESGVERCRVPWGWSSPFIRAGEDLGSGNGW
jgi:hypothetical protein